MKVIVRSSNGQQGGVLMVVLFIAVMFGIFLYSYLNVVRTQKMLVSRSQAWNTALTAAEAGIEEAMAQLNPGTPLPAILDKTANGWGAPVQGIYGPVSRSLTGGTYSVCYTVDTWPVVYSTGYVTVPMLGATITRVVRVATTNVPLFGFGLAAKNNVNFSGNNVTTDSYDSGNTNAWTPSSPKGTNGSIASLDGIVNVGNADVNGSVFLGPTATDSIKNNGVITGSIYNDFNVDFPDVTLPQTTWLPAAPNAIPLVIDGVSYQYSFGYPLPVSGDFVINNTFTGSIYVGTNSSVRLLINGSASPSNIRVAGPGLNSGKLILYLNGSSFTLTGQSSVDGGVANNLTYYGTTNNTTISFSGNANFVGTIYAPDADMTLGGGGSNNYDFVGASITKSFSMNGHFNFHFDEALLRAGPARAFLPKLWGEI